MATSPLICSANHWTGFYMIGTSVMKEFIAKKLRWWWMHISFALLKESNEINILKVIILTTKIPDNAGNIL